MDKDEDGGGQRMMEGRGWWRTKDGGGQRMVEDKGWWREADRRLRLVGERVCQREVEAGHI